MRNIKIGIIRWDAYTQTSCTSSYVSDQVAKALSPARYHGKIPFFCDVDSHGNAVFPPYTQDIWELEADMARDAGIDYFAYCWYRSDDVMSTARKHHASSKAPLRIKMAAILGVTNEDDASLNELFSCMKSDFYLKLDDGTPILFFFREQTGAEKVREPEEIRALAAKAGISKLYAVMMCMFVYNTEWRSKFITGGYDAVSFYGMPPGTPAMHYADLAAEAEFRNKYMVYAYRYNDTGLPLIPVFTLGRDARPRIDNPPTWAPNYSRYALPPQPEEMGRHVYNVMRQTEEYIEWCPAGCCHGYAWNEHDEGAGLCPTIAVTPDGKVIRNADGTPEINRTQLDEFKKYVSLYRSGQ